MAVLTRNSVLSSSSVWATWAFPFLGLLQQSLPKWPFLPQFEQWIGLSYGPSFGDLFVFFVPSPFPELPPPSLALLRLRVRAYHSSSMRRSLPCWSEIAVILHYSMLRRCPVTSSTVSLSKSSRISIEIVTCLSGSDATCNIFFTISASVIFPPRTAMLFARPVRRIKKSSTDSPSLNQTWSKSFRSYSAFASLTHWTLIRRDLIFSQVDCAVRLVESDANISGGTARSIAANARRSSRYSTSSSSSSSRACQIP
jgi:hypothetical protein